jgi:hypothetical protein
VSADYEVRPDCLPAEVTAGYGEAYGQVQPYWQAQIPWGSHIVWSSNRNALSAWLRAAADAVDALPPAQPLDLGDTWPDQGPAPDPLTGQVAA